MDKIIDDYEVQLVEAGCAPGSSRYGALLSFNQDISAVMPYLNAVMDSPRYDPDNRILVLREKDQAYALRPTEINIARTSDWHQAQELAAEIVEQINNTWQQRHTITPRLTEIKIPAVINIFKLLPKTNCRKCGYLTCLAFSADLCQGKALLEHCPPLSPETREQVLALFAD
ncbi:MAG: (Fe-S)-binding protein [Dehalococcoidales bacterium]|nr:(Fe-S)-binding protein [Dehalococcoidales bacterium]MDP6632362.1 (Fe-S)-binding protein [Dehalococcoidales bacterium]